MKIVLFASIILILVLLFPCHQVISYEIQESITSNNRPFYLMTYGETQQRAKLPIGCIFILHMLKPWPDQTYSTLFGIIFYKDGETTIYNNETNETFSADGPHTIVFYKFYGPTSSVEKNNVSFEGNAAYATIIGG